MNKPVFGELFLDRADGRNAIHLFTAQPSPLEEKNLGRAFVLLEFEQAESFIEEIVNTIDEVFSAAYYRSTDFETEAAFERSLHKVNNAVHDLIKAHGEGWTYRCNGLIGVIFNNHIYLSTVGKVEGYLVQANQMVDVIQRSQTVEVQPLKLFNSLIAGACPERGALLFSTANLLDYLSLEKLRRIITDRSAQDAVEHLTTLLSEHDAPVNLAAFVVKFERQAETTTITPKPDQLSTDALETTASPAFSNHDSDSMSTLIEREKVTGDLLAPSIWPSIKQKLQYVSTPNASKTEQRRAVTENYAKSQNPFVNSLLVVAKVIVNVLRQVGLGLLWLLKIVLLGLQKLFKNRDSITTTVNGSMSGAVGFWKRLTTVQKAFLALLVITLVVIGISVLTKDRSTERAEVNENYATTLQTVENKLGEVESKQIIKDDSGARSLLAEAQTALNTVPTDSKAYAAGGAELQAKVTELDGVLNKVTVQDAPTVAADFSNSVGSASLGSITLIGKNIFALASSSAGTWRANLEKQAISEVLADDSSTTGYRSVENDSSATSLAVVNNAEVLQFNPVLEKTSAVEVALKDDDTFITDIDIFGDRLYVLAAKQNRIVRLQKSGSSYGSATAWLNDGVDVSQAVSFDIDGSVYILMTDGSISKYDGGAKSEFTVDAFNPSLAGSTKLIKNDPADPFIVLNPTQQRIVVLDSEAKLQAQYVSSSFANAKDAIYDADTKTIYVLSDNKVYSITL